MINTPACMVTIYSEWLKLFTCLQASSAKLPALDEAAGDGAAEF